VTGDGIEGWCVVFMGAGQGQHIDNALCRQVRQDLAERR